MNKCYLRRNKQADSGKKKKYYKNSFYGKYSFCGKPPTSVRVFFTIDSHHKYEMNRIKKKQNALQTQQV